MILSTYSNISKGTAVSEEVKAPDGGFKALKCL